MIDVFGVLSTPMSDKILAEKIFLNPNPDPELVTRILTHLATKPNSPHEVQKFRKIATVDRLNNFDYVLSLA